MWYILLGILALIKTTLNDITFCSIGFFFSNNQNLMLQRQFLMFKKPERSDMEIINNHEPFLYKLVGTWAFSPHPKNWRLFLDWFNSIEDVDTFDPYVPGIVTSDWLHMHNSMGKRHMTWVNIKHVQSTEK